MALLHDLHHLPNCARLCPDLAAYRRLSSALCRAFVSPKSGQSVERESSLPQARHKRSVTVASLSHATATSSSLQAAASLQQLMALLPEPLQGLLLRRLGAGKAPVCQLRGRFAHGRSLGCWPQLLEDLQGSPAAQCTPAVHAAQSLPACAQAARMQFSLCQLASIAAAAQSCTLTPHLQHGSTCLVPAQHKLHLQHAPGWKAAASAPRALQILCCSRQLYTRC